MSIARESNADVIRAYAASDREACLRLFDGNVPDFFVASERQDFMHFLEREGLGRSYLVITRAGRIVACGGYAIESDGVTASLAWGMVDRVLQRSGLGSRLTEARLRAARSVPGVMQVRLDTSQHTQGFYARFGFQVIAIRKDGYAPELDRWDMLLRF